jgi:hypothetical protein
MKLDSGFRRNDERVFEVREYFFNLLLLFG